VWKSDDGTVMTINVSDPYSGSNTYNCTLSNANYTCALDQTDSYTSGDLLQAVYDINPS
jgi:hypothetical protein